MFAGIVPAHAQEKDEAHEQVPSALKYFPMSDTVDLTCQTQFDGLTPKKCSITWISRPIGAANSRCGKTMIEPESDEPSRLLAHPRG